MVTIAIDKAAATVIEKSLKARTNFSVVQNTESNVYNTIIV